MTGDIFLIKLNPVRLVHAEILHFVQDRHWHVNLYAEVAQLVERRTENPGVGGSIPPLGTIFTLDADSE